MRESYRPFLTGLILSLFFNAFLFAQTTGKIAGVVFELDSDEPVSGANIYLDELPIGASTDENGAFFILNVPPGNYTLNVQMIGYSNYQVQDLRISVNRTSYIKAGLTPSIMEGEIIVVQADKISTKKDQTSSIRNISSDQLDVLPVENLNAVINMQAGVVDGHFRGGRSNEVSFMIDGVNVVDSYGGESNSVTLETDVIEDVEIITGTFNAEYGRAMSGIVNAVTKEGSNEFHGSISSSMSNYLTANDNVFIGLKDTEFDRNKDIKFQLTGPLIKDKLTFLFNTRFQDNKGYLNGIERFKATDYSEYPSSDPNSWVIAENGNNKYVPMNFSKLNSWMGKLSSHYFEDLNLSLLYTRNDEEWRDYSHDFKYNPDGVGTNHKISDLLSFKVNNLVNKTMFFDFTISYLNSDYGWYIFENPENNQYVHDNYLVNNNSGPGFYTGGQQKDHTIRTTKDINTKLDLTWQFNEKHLLKTGVLFTHHTIDHQWHSIQNAFRARSEDENAFYFNEDSAKIYPNYQPLVLGDSSRFSDIYKVTPFEWSGYIQDKMEFDQMVVNLGFRFDYFDPQTKYPSQRRNPANQEFYEEPEKVSTYIKAKPQYQISPRLGLSYQLGTIAVFHFSYGHFFQMPPMYSLYQNNSFLVPPGNYVTTMGNSQLEAQKTVQYEFGLWQEVMPDMGLEIVVFYRDIYNLLSTKFVTTYTGTIYGLYSNKDYGNVKGLEIKWDYKISNFTAYVNYTLQYTRGNADDPTQTFNRAGESRDPVPTLIPMSWDQRNTFNLTVGYNTSEYGATLTGYYNSGTPYTWNPISTNLIANVNLLPNNSYQRSTYSIDLNGYYELYKNNNIKLRLNFSIYNFLDRLNDSWVNSTTGRAYTEIIQESDLSSHLSNFNNYSDTVKDPSMYQAPRLFKAGISISY